MLFMEFLVELVNLSGGLFKGLFTGLCQLLDSPPAAPDVLQF